MATVGNTYMTLADAYRMQGPLKGKARIIEMLAQYNPAVKDANVVECNMGEEHFTSVRTGLPEPTWRKLYQGVQPTKGTTAEVKDSTGMAEDWSEVDAKLVDKQKNPAVFRLNQAKGHLMGMANTVEEYIWYGDQATNPAAFTGLAPRFSSLSAGSGSQIIDAGGTGSDNMSIWFVTWSEEHCHLLFPEGSVAGVQRQDKGVQTKEKADGSLYDVYREKFTWDVGFTCRDYRGVSRVANIDVSDLARDPADGGAYLADKMIDAYYTLQNPGMEGGKTIVYANKTAQKFLHKQALTDTNVNLTLENVNGMPVTKFLGHDIHRADALLETEARVV